MTRQWMLLGVTACLGLALPGGPTLAGADAVPEVGKKLDEIQKQLDEVKKVMAGLDAIKQDLERIRTDANLGVQTAVGNINLVKEQFTTIQRQLDALRSQMSGSVQKSYYPSAAASRLRLVNSFTAPATILVDGSRAVRLDPGQERIVDHAAGTFTYEVLVDGYGSVQPRLTRTVNPSETFTITVFIR